MAIIGNTALVGAIFADDGGSDSGSAYLFVPEPTTLLLAATAGIGLLARRRKTTTQPHTAAK